MMENYRQLWWYSAHTLLLGCLSVVLFILPNSQMCAKVVASVAIAHFGFGMLLTCRLWKTLSDNRRLAIAAKTYDGMVLTSGNSTVFIGYGKTGNDPQS